MTLLIKKLIQTASNLLIAPCNAFVTYMTVFRPEGFASHALDAEHLTVESSFRVRTQDPQ